MKLGNIKFLLERRSKEYTGKRGFYCCMPVKNVDEVKAAFQKCGLKSNVDELHVTIMYSEKDTPTKPTKLHIPFLNAKVTGYDMFGPKNDTLVLKLDCPKLNEIHEMYTVLGAVHSYDEYHPHMTVIEGVELTDEVKAKIEKLVKELPSITLHKLRFEDIVTNE